MSGSIAQKLTGAFGQCFADANIQRHLNVRTQFHYYDRVDSDMHIDLMFNKTSCDGAGNVMSCQNYFVDVKTATERYGRSCSLPADVHYMKSFLDKDYWLAFVFRDAHYVSMTRLTTHFVDTYFHLANVKTSIYVKMDELERDNVYSKLPADFIKIPTVSRDGLMSFNQFCVVSGFTGNELGSSATQHQLVSYVHDELYPRCQRMFGINNDIG